MREFPFLFFKMFVVWFQGLFHFRSVLEIISKGLITFEFSTPGLNFNPFDRGETPSHLATQSFVDFNFQLYGQISTLGLK